MGTKDTRAAFVSEERRRIYPVSTMLADSIRDQLPMDLLDQELPGIHGQMVELLGEYEHGSADIADVLPELYERLMEDVEEGDEVDTKDVEQTLLRAMSAVMYEVSLFLLHSKE